MSNTSSKDCSGEKLSVENRRLEDGRRTGGVESVSSLSKAGAPLNFTWLAEGDDVPIVLVHGFGSSISGWQPFLSALPSGHAIMAVDLPGHGRSVLGEEVSFDGFATAVETTIRTAGISCFHLVGHSLGAAVAARVVAKASLEARSLTLLAPAGLEPRINLAFLEGFTKASDEQTLGNWMHELVADPAYIVPAFVRSTLKPRNDVRFVAGQIRIIEQFFPGGIQSIAIQSDLNCIKIPVSIVVGTGDRVIESSSESSLPDSVALHRLDDVGHLPHIERRDEVAKILLQSISASRLDRSRRDSQGNVPS